MKRVLVCGGRFFSNRHLVWKTLDKLHHEVGIDTIIEGNATGVDTFACRWAWLRGVANLKYAALWRVHGNAAGPIRNQWMLDHGKPDLVLAFQGGNGTADMVRRAKKAGVDVMEIDG